MTGARSGKRSRLRAALSALSALVLLVAPPMLLIRFVGSPASGFPRDLDQLQQWWDQRYLPAQLVASVLAIILWILWGQFVWALLWELFVAGPRAARGLLGSAAPGVPRFTRSLVASLVSGALSAGLVATTAGPSLAPFVAAVAPFSQSAGPVLSAAEQVDVARASPLVGGPRLYQVRAQDSLWRLAGQDDAMVKRILALNEDQLRTALDLRPGMVLKLPDALILAPGLAEVAAEEPVAETPAAGAATSVHVVERGDTLWAIAEDHLVQAGTVDPTNRAIVDQVSELVGDNQSVIEDPDLIYPGEVLRLPASGGRPSATGPATPAPSGHGQPVADPDGATPPEQVEADAPGALGSAPLATDTLSAAQRSEAVVATVVATAIAALVQTARRRRRAAAGFVGPAGIDEQQLLSDLADATDPALVAWAGQELYPLNQVAAPVRSVSLSSDDGIQVRWDKIPEVTIEGWTPLDPLTWHRSYPGPGIGIGGPLPVAVPGLVTVGSLVLGDGLGGQILVNLATLGSLSIAGPTDQTLNLVRAMVYELGLGGSLSNAAVTLVGFTLGLSDRLPRVKQRSAAMAMAAAGERAARDSAGATSPDSPIDVYLVRAEDPSAARFLDLAAPGSGVAVVVVGDLRSSRVGDRLVLASDGGARLQSLDIDLRAAALTERQELDLEMATDLGTDRAGATAGPGDQLSAREVVSRWAVTGPAATSPSSVLAGRRSAVGEPGAPRVCLLGPVRCEGRPELVAHALSLVAFLALQPERQASLVDIGWALWGDRPVSDHQVGHVVAVARSVLGAVHLPAGTLGPSTVALRQIETDVEVLQALALGAEGAAPDAAAPLLRQALDLIAGPPLAGVPLRWAAAGDLADYVSELVEAVVMETLEVARRIGDRELAGEAIRRGLAALPANERLYRAWMLLAAGSHNTTLVQSIYRSLEVALETEWAGAIGPANPSEATIALYRSLLASGSEVPVGPTGA